MSAMQRKIGRNDPCWCGSGSKFKHCHLRRADAAPIAVGHLRDVVRREFSKKICMHPEAPRSCGRIIKAHTIQRRRTLECIAGNDGTVATFYPVDRDARGHPILRRRGWRRASTFDGFCESHDKIFAPLESRTFDGEPAQCFLIGYRALCHEIYQKSAAARSEPFLREHLDRGFSLNQQVEIQHKLEVAAAGRQKGIEDMQRIKRIYDHALLQNDFSALASCVIWFRGNLSLVSTGMVHADHDAHGMRLQNLADMAVPVQGTGFGVVATPEGGAFVFSWLRSDELISSFIQSIISQPAQDIPSILVEFMFAYVENTYFSETWWRELSDAARHRILELAGTTIQYGFPVGYSRQHYVDWREISIEFR